MMKNLWKGIAVLIMAIALPYSAWSAQTITGDLSGTFTGSATDGSASYSGSIEGNWSASGTFDAAGNFVETVSGSGTFGGIGISGSWQVTGYNSATNTISVSWVGPGNRGPSKGTSDGSVNLVVDTATGIASGSFQGQIYTADGAKNISGTWTIRFQGLSNNVVTGKIQGTFSGSASYVGNIGGSVTGDWVVRFMPDGSVSGTASGRYDGGNISLGDYGSVCICGTWIASVNRGSDGQFRLEGSWTHPMVTGTLDGSGGGPIVWYINTATNPIQANGNFSGSTVFTIPMTAPIPAQSISITTSGNWEATLPINP